ncbi:ankyrin [Sporothrix schenckii 1099-18]|uniref:Ankyrin n=1 Tax=Sporothrix schenckii 1099-18 TaxID=1397361 RepID=A0A0F2M9P3_SPOSC|nr:ankyrin [Sporothrix schenckii 1099-18]KJR85804.1 ankyrin [Sporothrix schenckii 1099-18]
MSDTKQQTQHGEQEQEQQQQQQQHQPQQQQPQGLPDEAIALASRLYNGARAGDLALFQQALPAGLPANLANEKGDSLLMLAAYYGHANLVRLLLHHGADPNRLNDKGQSPLAGAVFKAEDAVIEALLEGGADPEFGSPTPLETIVMFRQEDKWRAAFEAAPGRGQAGK